MGCPSVATISKTECIGNSLPTINNNFKTLETEVCDNAASIISLQSGYQNLLTQTNLLSSYVNQVIPTVLFVPVNYSTESNNNPRLQYWYVDNSSPTQIQTPGTNTNSVPWWSGIKTVTIPTPPANTVATLIHVWANANTYQNSGQLVYMYKQSEQGSVFGGANGGNPPNSGLGGNITSSQLGGFNGNFRKIAIDPTGGSNLGSYEGDYELTLPIYIEPTTNEFKWFWVDTKNGGTPTGNPEFSLEIYLLGYYIKIV